jgi:hypothetical protein
LSVRMPPPITPPNINGSSSPPPPGPQGDKPGRPLQPSPQGQPRL